MTTTLNKSNIFTAAWMMVREFGIKISEALQTAWAYAKGTAVAIPAKTEKVYEGVTGSMERTLDIFKNYCDARNVDCKVVLAFEYEEGDAAFEFFSEELSAYTDGFYKAASTTEYSKNNVSPLDLISKSAKAFENYRTVTMKNYQF